MSTQRLKNVYASTLVQAKGRQAPYAPPIEQQARVVNVNRIAQTVRTS